MSHRPLLDRQVGCCDYNFFQEAWKWYFGDEKYRNTPLTYSAYREGYAFWKKNTLNITSVALNVFSLVMNKVFADDESKPCAGTQTLSGLSIFAWVIGICVLQGKNVCGSSITNEEYDGSRATERCVNDTTIVFTVSALAFSIFTMIYVSVSGDC